jgi:hypothetical protein
LTSTLFRRGLSLSGAFAFLYPFITAFPAYFPLFSGKPDKRAKRKKEGLMMKCGKLFVVGIMLTALVVASA